MQSAFLLSKYNNLLNTETFRSESMACKEVPLILKHKCKVHITKAAVL